MTQQEVEQLADKFVRNELLAIMGFAYSNFSGGVSIENADAHFAAGCDHLKQLRPKLVEIMLDKFKDQP